MKIAVFSDLGPFTSLNASREWSKKTCIDKLHVT